jgi:hypothetical protein
VNGAAARASVALVAVVLLAWLGLMERSTRLLARGVEATAHQEFAKAEADFRAAAFLNPDTTPDLRRSFVYEASSRQRQATALIEEVLRREPDNRSAWGVLEEFTRQRDPATSARARAALRRLDPLNAAPR